MFDRTRLPFVALDVLCVLLDGFIERCDMLKMEPRKMKDLKKFRLENTGVSDEDSCLGISIHQMLLNGAKAGLPLGVLNLAKIKPYQRGFFCNDDSIKYPFHDSTITSTVLYTVGFTLPIFSGDNVSSFSGENSLMPSEET
ncbi:hypothetical protein EK904_014997 [Melospiza melodia maxima]|nr:hypothetical protein EK904_014997 [Melospiza melodia maxima]